MTTNPQLLALLAQLREAARDPASAGFASGGPGRAAPLVTAQAGSLPLPRVFESSHAGRHVRALSLFKLCCSKQCCLWLVTPFAQKHALATGSGSRALQGSNLHPCMQPQQTRAP